MEAVGIILSYWVVSTSVIFLNKWLVTRHPHADISLFLTWFQCTVAFILILASLQFRRRYLNHKIALPVVSVHYLLHTDMLLLTASLISMLTFNSFCLRFVGVAFYQLSRSTSLLFIVLLSFCLLGERPSRLQLAACWLVGFGFTLSLSQERLTGTLSAKGLFFCLLTSLCVAVNAVFTKRCLRLFNNDVVPLIFNSSLSASLLSLPILLMSDQLATVRAVYYDTGPVFVGYLAVSGMLGFLIHVISGVQINCTSPLTHNLVTNARSAFVTMLAVVVEHSVKTGLWWLSNLLVLVGASAYVAAKVTETKTLKVS